MAITAVKLLPNGIISKASILDPLVDDVTSLDATLNGLWTAYAMAWTASTTNPVIGNGTITSRFMKVGAHLLAVRSTIACGSTSTKGAGSFIFSLPQPIVGDAIGSFLVNDAGIAFRIGIASASGSTLQLYRDSSGGALAAADLTGTFTSSSFKFSILCEV